MNPQQVREFIDNYLGKVSPEYVNAIRNYSYANLAFKEKTFGKCLEFLAKVDKPLYRINLYKLRICSLYEEGFLEEEIFATDSLKQYLKRNNRIGFLVRMESVEFLRGFQSLMNLRNG